VKTKIMFYLLLVSVVVFPWNSSALEDVSDMEATEDSEKTLNPQGTQDRYNTYYGSGAGYASPDEREFNSFFGASSGTNNKGHGNSFFGYRAGYNNRGSSNCLIGSAAGSKNRGSNNVGIGQVSGEYVEGDDNCFIGHGVAREAFSAKDNTIIGSEAGKAINPIFTNRKSKI